MRATVSSTVSPTRAGMTTSKKTMAPPATRIVAVWPMPHSTPIRAAVRRRRSRLTMVPTAITWSGSVAWRIPRKNPRTARGRSVNTAPRLGPERGEDTLGQQLHGAQHLGLLHARPLDAEDEAVGLEAGGVALDLAHRVVGVAHDEAVRHQLLELLREAVSLGQRLVLAPRRIGLVLGLEEGLALADGGAAVGRQVELLDDGQLRRERAAGLAEGLAVHAHLALEHGQLGVRVDDPRVAEARGPDHRGVVVRGEPDRRVRPLHRAQHHARAGQVEEAPVMRHLVARPQPLDHLEAFDETPDPLLGRDPERLVLLLAIAEPNPEDEAPLGDDV